MSEKKATGYKAQSSVVINRNKAAKAARHAFRMGTQMSRDPASLEYAPNVERGSARRQRRAPLAIIYAKRLAAGNIPA